MMLDDLAGKQPDSSLELPAFEDEILDRQAGGIDGWTFSCCMSIDDEDAPKRELAPAQRPLTRPALDEEILDRPWQADGFYTICCTMGISPDEGDVQRSVARAQPESMGNDPMVDVMLLAGASLLDADARP